MGLGAYRTVLARACLLGALPFCFPALAEDDVPTLPIERCDYRAHHVQRLKWLAQQPAAVGLTDSGAVLELYVSERGDWTVIITAPAQRMTCITAHGEAMELAILGEPG
jgi:hypothetical protein